jgi:hypothetical protein
MDSRGRLSPHGHFCEGQRAVSSHGNFFRRSIGKFLVKGVKGAESVQVIGKMGNIKFKIFPVYPGQFAILEIESKKKEKLW